MAGIDQSWVSPGWLKRAKEAAEVLIPYVPDRRATGKTDLVEIISAIEANYNRCPFIEGGPFRGARGIPVRVYEKPEDPDEKTPKKEGELRVVLTKEELDLAKDADGNSILRQTIEAETGEETNWLIVPHGAATWSTSALGFQKHMLVLEGKVKAEQLEHDDAEDIFGELVWLGKADKDEMFAAKIVWLALVGIRAANDPSKFGPSVLAPIQDPDQQIKSGWYMDPVIEYMLRVREAGISSSTPSDSAAIFEIKNGMRVFLYSIAERFYELRELEPKWQEGRLEHRDVSKAVDNHVWKFDPARRAKIELWRDRADKCVFHQLKKKADRWDLSRSDIDRALASDLLYQWMEEKERAAKEKGIYYWVDSYLFKEAVHFSHCLFGFGVSQARRLISDGYATVWSDDPVAECEFLLDFAWESDRATEVWSLLKRYEPSYGLGAVDFDAEDASKAIIRSYESGKIAMADVTWLSDRLGLGISAGTQESSDASLLAVVRDRYESGDGGSKSINWFATRGPGGTDRR